MAESLRKQQACYRSGYRDARDARRLSTIAPSTHSSQYTVVVVCARKGLLAFTSAARLPSTASLPAADALVPLMKVHTRCR
jgi:hypothetical protein